MDSPTTSTSNSNSHLSHFRNTAFTFSIPVHSSFKCRSVTPIDRRKPIHISCHPQHSSVRATASSPAPLPEKNSTNKSTTLQKDADISTFTVETSALRQGIKSIAVGKYGEKPIPPELIPAIEAELCMAEYLADSAPSDLLLLRASFLGSLFMKRKINLHEYRLLVSATIIPRTAPYAGGRCRHYPEHADEKDSTLVGQNNVSVTAGHVISTVVAPLVNNNTRMEYDDLSEYAMRLLCGEQLDMDAAEALGKLLYANEPPTPVKALIAHVMRVRHESVDELCGLGRAVVSLTKKTVESETDTTNNRFVLLSEPFDGAVTWDLLTPLIARHLSQVYGLNVIIPSGESSGPKYGPNVRSLYAQLHSLLTPSQYKQFGQVSDQMESNPGLAQWTHMRRVIVKRPALATVEKFADPCTNGGAQLFIGSSFHPSYIDKMGAVAEAIGYTAFIIVSKGMEGCIGQGVGENRDCNALVGWKCAETGVYKRENISMKCIIEDDVDDQTVVKNGANVQDTVNKILSFVESDNGKSGDGLFDVRTRTTLLLLDQALARILYHLPSIFE